ncbi:MAG: 3'-5' exonuclease [Acidobacteriota bacterium]|nr:3'-5' exonuclease [Acidobacteriota bacterium]
MTPSAAAYASSPIDRGRTPWRSAHFCVVDLELTGLDAREDEVISFAAVPVDAGRVVVGATVAGLCRPTRPVPESTVLVHGLRSVDVAEAPELAEAVQPLLAAMTGRVMVAHEAWVERGFLTRALRAQGVRFRGPAIDTYQLARLWAGLADRPDPPRDLGALAASLGLPSHRPHDAVGDALTTAQVFVALATLLEARTRETVTSLANARRRASFEAR